MRPSLARLGKKRGSMRVGLSCLLAVLVPACVWAVGPSWWTTGGVLNSSSPQDYAAVNQGQVKNIAKQAYEELKVRLPGGAGATLDAIWANPAASTNDYQAINLGQLKNVAKPFYDQLISVGYTTQYPWTGSANPADDYALANIGQVKNLFSFDLSTFSAANTNTLIVVSGDQQTGPSGQVLRQALTVRVVNGQGLPVTGVTVSFAVTAGSGTISTASSGAGGGTTLTVTTGLLGQTLVYLNLIGANGSLNQVSASLAQGGVTFQAYVVGSVASQGGGAQVPSVPAADTPNPGGDPTSTSYYIDTNNPGLPIAAATYVSVQSINRVYYLDNDNDATNPIITWLPVAGFTNYLVQKRANLGQWGDMDTTTDTEAYDSGLLCGDLYEYRVLGIDDAGVRTVLSNTAVYTVPMIKSVDQKVKDGLGGTYDIVDDLWYDEFGYDGWSYLHNCIDYAGAELFGDAPFTVNFYPKNNALESWAWSEEIFDWSLSDDPINSTILSSESNPSPSARGADLVVIEDPANCALVYRGHYVPAYALSGLPKGRLLPLGDIQIALGNASSQSFSVNWTEGGIAATHMFIYGDSNADANPLSNGGTAIDADRIQFSYLNGGINNCGTVTITVNSNSITGYVSVFNLQLSCPSTPGVNIPTSEASGAKYRKIALNGAPLSDEKPQQAAESDQSPEETFIDALTLGLRHDTTDIYTTVPSADLSLSARRSATSEVWNVKNGLRPDERPDRPFGAGWTTNLAANIHFTHMVGEANEDGSNPDTATVTDENGAEYTFAILYGSDATYTNADGYTGSQTFVPLPSSNHEQSLYLCTLEKVGDSYVFTRKFGSTLVYSISGLQMGFASDRINGSSSGANHTYARLVSVTDRYGNQLNYGYSSPYTVVPKTITVRGSTSVALSIHQDTGGHITDIWDPSGYKVHYDYVGATYTDSTGTTHSYTTLSAVTMADGKTTNYTHALTTEPDQNPSDSANIGNYYHLELTKITDPLNHSYAFTYAFDQTKYDYSSDASGDGYYIKTGLPMQVTQTTLPDGSHATFVNDSSNLKVQRDMTSGVESLKSDWVRKNHVIDAKGNERDYGFTDPQVEELPSFATAYKHEVKFDNPRMVYYKTMMITPYTGSGTGKASLGGTETFTFDPVSGMSVTSAKDFSGNTTSYAYGDMFMNPVFSAAGASSGIYTAFSDPTSQSTSLGSKTFGYGKYRVMTSSKGENGVTTQWTVDHLGRRTEERIYAANSTTTVVQDTIFDYKDTAGAYLDPTINYIGISLNFMTKKTVKKLSSATTDPTWVTDLVTLYVPDANGRMAQEVVDMNGNGTIEPTVDLVTTYTYDSNGNKLTSTDPLNHTTTFSYDQRNRLIAVTYADNSQKQLFYDARGNKTKERDENNVATLWTYDALNRVTQQAVDMNGNGQIDAGTDLITSYEYDPLNARTKVTDANGHATTMTYDALERLVTKKDALNQTTTYAYGANSGGSVFDSSGFKPTTVTDPRGYHTNVTYDALYRPTAESTEYQTGVYATTNKTYDAVGNLLTVTDPLGTVTHTTYDALRRPTSVTEAFGTTLAATTTKAYTSTGLAWQVTDPLGRTTTTDYDHAGRPITVTAPAVADALHANASAHPVTQTVYDAAGNAVAVINPLGRQTDTTYDARNRPVTVRLPAALDATTGQTARATHTTAYDLVGNVIAVQDARGFVTTTTYDPARRPKTVTAPPVTLVDGTVVNPVTSSTYDKAGNVLTVTDANGHTTTNTYDALNRLHTTTDAASITVTYAYDAAGNRTDVYDGLNQRTQFTYDGLNRNLTVTDPANHAVTFTYDALNKTTRLDSLGQTTSYTYDARHRLTGVTYAGRTADNRTYAYDADNELLAVTEPGKSQKADVAYSYDALGRQLSETSGGLTHAYAYDLAGNRVKVTYGGTGTVLTSAYDELNRLSTLTENSRTTTYGYDLAGNRVLQQMPDGEIVSTQFDPLNRQAAETTSKNSSGALVLQLAQAYDAAGNVKKVTETYFGSTLKPRTVTNTYDGINRLTVETTVQGATTTATAYTYDAANNRTQKAVSTTTGSTNTTVGTTYAYNSLNQLQTATTGTAVTSYTYDLNGNRATATAAGQTDTYAYDYENRLVTLAKATTGGTGSYAYVYDYRTRRVERAETTGSTTTVTKSVFSGGVSVSEYVGTTNTAEYIRGSDWGGGVGGLLYSVRSGVPSYKHYNSRGDVITETNASAAATWQASYEAFGTRTQEVGTTQDRQKANTKEEDPTGLLNEGFRYRDFATGTFITRDPLGFVDGPNMYAYVVQNPWSKFDPEGLSSSTPVLDATIGILQALAAPVTVAYNTVVHNDQLTTQIANQWMADSAASEQSGRNGTLGALNRFNPAAQVYNGVTGEDLSNNEHLNTEQRFQNGASGVYGLALIAAPGVKGPGGVPKPPVVTPSADVPPVVADASALNNTNKVGAGGTTPAPTATAPYADIPDHPSVGPGKAFTQAQKAKILAANRAANGGQLTSDMSGKPLEPPQQSKAGVKPSPNEAQVDHVKARSKGGANSNSNAQVLSREENIKKSDN